MLFSSSAVLELGLLDPQGSAASFTEIGEHVLFPASYVTTQPYFGHSSVATWALTFFDVGIDFNEAIHRVNRVKSVHLLRIDPSLI